MKNILATLCLTVAVLLGCTGVSASADYQKGVNAYKSGDYATALRQFQPLAELGNVRAQTMLASMYEEGKGVPQNNKTAVQWYRLAAKQGNAAAQLNLGVRYHIGEGVKKNDINAYMWWSKAADQGHKKAKKFLSVIAKKMTPSQLKKAKAGIMGGEAVFIMNQEEESADEAEERAIQAELDAGGC